MFSARHWVSLAGALVIILVVAGTVNAFVRNARALASARDEVRAINESLERRVDERTSALKVALDRAELLLSEVNHRVANSLAMVGSLVRLQGRASNEPSVREALSETQARIQAVAAVHKRLYSSGDVGLVALDEYLSALLQALATSMREEGSGAALRWELGQRAPDLLPPLPDGQSANVVFTGDGSALLRYVDSSEGTLWQHQPGAWMPVAVPVPAQQVLADVVAAVDLDTGMAASSSDGHTVWIEPARGRAQLLSDGDGVIAAAVQLDADQIVVGYTSGRVQLWDTARGREVASQPPVGKSAVASLSVGNGNKSVLAKYRAPGAFRLFDARLQEVPQPWPTVGALLGDEAQLAEDAVRAASVADGILRILVEGSPAPAWVSSGVAATLKWYFVKAEWSGDGSLLLTQQTNLATLPHRPEVAVWQWNRALQTLDLLLVYGAESAAWRPDNAYLLGIGSDTLLNGQLHLVPVWPDPAPLIDRLRRDADAAQPGCPLTRSISPQQMQGYLMEAKPQP